MNKARNKSVYTIWAHCMMLRNRQNLSMVIEVRTVVVFGIWGTFWSDGNILYFYFVGGYIIGFLYQNVSNCTLKSNVFYCMQILPQFKKRYYFYNFLWLYYFKIISSKTYIVISICWNFWRLYVVKCFMYTFKEYVVIIVGYSILRRLLRLSLLIVL